LLVRRSEAAPDPAIAAKSERMILKRRHISDLLRVAVQKPKEPVMRTTLPLRVSETRSGDGLVSFCRALLPFYLVIALLLLSITGIEMHFGMYPSATFSEALFGTYGVDAETCPTGSLQASPQHCTDSTPFAPG
jgi:hypothetical protein